MHWSYGCMNAFGPFSRIEDVMACLHPQYSKAGRGMYADECECELFIRSWMRWRESSNDEKFAERRPC